MNNKSDRKNAFKGAIAIALALIIAVMAFSSEPRVTVMPTVVGILGPLGLIWGVQLLRGQALKIAALGLLGLGTLSGLLMYVFAANGMCSQGMCAGVAPVAYLLTWLISTSFIWIEYLKTKKLGKTPADIERSYRVIVLTAALFSFLPLLLSVVMTVQS